MKILKIIAAAGVGLTAFVGSVTPGIVRFNKEEPLETEFGKPKEEEITYDEEKATPVYALHDTHSYYNTSLISGTNLDIALGEEVIIYGEVASENYEKYFISKDGYLRHTDFTFDKNNVFYPVDEILYAKQDALLLDAPNEWSSIVEELSLNDEISVCGINEAGYYRLTDNHMLYIHKKDLMDTIYIEPKPEPVILPETETANTYVAPGSGGLTPSTGVYAGPSGKETYYNLDMSGVISIARSAGINGDYWVRGDGVKMYGDYIICACGFSVRPRGTVVQTSLGPGICLDTGGFAENDPYQIDIAVTW